MLTYQVVRSSDSAAPITLRLEAGERGPPDTVLRSVWKLGRPIRKVTPLLDVTFHIDATTRLGRARRSGGTQPCYSDVFTWSYRTREER